MGGQGSESCICVLLGPAQGLAHGKGHLSALMRHHLPWPHWPRSRPHPSSPGSPERRLTGPGLSSQHGPGLATSPSPLPGLQRVHHHVIGKASKSLEARFTQRVHHWREAGREGTGNRKRLQRGAPERRQGGGGRGPTAGCAPGQPGAHHPRPLPCGSPYAPSLASLHLFPNLPGVQRHLEETTGQEEIVPLPKH